MDAGELVPVAVQVSGTRVEEEHPRDGGTTFGVAGRVEVHVLGEQRVTGALPGEHVPAPAEQDRGSCVAKRVEQREHARVGMFDGRFGEAGPIGLAGEVVQMDGLDLVQFENPGEGVEDLRRGGAGLVLLQPCVVASTDAGEVSQFFSAQTWNAWRRPSRPTPSRPSSPDCTSPQQRPASCISSSVCSRSAGCTGRTWSPRPEMKSQ
jgi:hypothetical protein